MAQTNGTRDNWYDKESVLKLLQGDLQCTKILHIAPRQDNTWSNDQNTAIVMVLVK